MKKKVTLDDIAKATGLSKYAVSRAISGKSGVSDKTRAYVLQVCDDLGYIRHVPPIHNNMILFAPKSEMDTAAFWMRVIQGIETAAAQQEYRLTVKTVEESTEESEIHSLLQTMAGAFFIGHKTGDLIQRVQGLCPTLLLTYPPIPLLKTDCINISDCEAMESLCDHMIALGHRHIAYYGPVGRTFGTELILGISRSMEKTGLSAPEIWCDSEQPSEYENTIRLLSKHYNEHSLPSAILCASDRLAQSVIYGLNQLSVSVPQEVSVTSFNSDTGMSPVIPLTTMGFNKFDYGMEAFKILYQRILDPHQPFRRIRYLQNFIPGATAGLAPQNHI